MDDPGEQVLCVSRADLEKAGLLPLAGYRDLFRKAGHRGVLDPLPYAFHARASVEQDPTLKQIIPYVVVRAHDETDSILAYRRPAKGGEPRLSGKISIGVGGHINPCDDVHEGWYLSDVVTACAFREMSEELRFLVSEGRELVFRGLVNNDDTPVGQVHLGVVMELACLGRYVLAGSCGVDEGQYLERDALLMSPEDLEGWSLLLLADPAARFLG